MRAYNQLTPICWRKLQMRRHEAESFRPEPAQRADSTPISSAKLPSNSSTSLWNQWQGAFGADIDYVTFVKIYGVDPNAERRYNPPVCLGCYSKTPTGMSDPKNINTSYVERQNLTMRMSMRRFTRLTNAFSTKVENHAAAMAFMHRNFGRVRQTLRITPAMAAGVAKHVWTIEEVVRLNDLGAATSRGRSRASLGVRHRTCVRRRAEAMSRDCVSRR